MSVNSLSDYSHEAVELFFYITQTGEIYNGPTKHCLASLAKHVSKGRYDTALAVKAYKHLADQCAKLYVQEHGTKDVKWHEMFNVESRQQCAAALEDYYHEHLFPPDQPSREEIRAALN